MKKLLLCFLLLLGVAVSVDAQEFAYKKGYVGNVELELGCITGTYGFDSGVLTTHGYGTGNGWFFGGGAGLFVTPNHHAVVSIPIYADVRYNFCKSAVSPFVDLKVGTVMNVEELTSGLYASPSVGVMINRFAISLKYGFYNGYSSYMAIKGLEETFYNTHALSVGLTIMF